MDKPFKIRAIGPWKADLEQLTIGNKSAIILNSPTVYDPTLSVEDLEDVIALAAQAPALKEIAEAFMQYLEAVESNNDTLLINHIKHILNKTDVKFLKQ